MFSWCIYYLFLSWYLDFNSDTINCGDGLLKQAPKRNIFNVYFLTGFIWENLFNKFLAMLPNRSRIRISDACQFRELIKSVIPRSRWFLNWSKWNTTARFRWCNSVSNPKRKDKSVVKMSSFYLFLFQIPKSQNISQSQVRINWKDLSSISVQIPQYNL